MIKRSAGLALLWEIGIVVMGGWSLLAVEEKRIPERFARALVRRMLRAGRNRTAQPQES